MKEFSELQETVKARLKEMGAVVESFGRQAESAQAEARERMKRAAEDIRQQQAEMRKQLDVMRGVGNERWKRGRRELERLWSEFESLTRDTAARFGSERETYLARAQAKLESWRELADHYGEQIVLYAEKSHKDMESVIADLRERHRETQTRLRELGGASADAWQAMAEGFEKAWSELEKAGARASAAFRATQEEPGKGKKGSRS